VKARIHLLWISVLLLLVVSCAPPPVVPTVMQIPTDTPTSTPTRTPILSDTPTPTRTNTPTKTNTPTATYTPTPTFTPTLTPSLTFTPSDTPTITPTETPTLTETPTETPTMTPTDTLTPSATYTATVIPVINFFAVTPNSAVSGSTVVAQWSADAEKVTLDMLTESGVILQTFTVATNGQLNFTVNIQNGSPVVFRLTAVKAGITTTKAASVTVSCPSPWFFNPAPNATGCPQAAITGSFTYQPFERGLMFYVPNTNAVYAMAYENSRATAYANPGVTFPTVVPPPGQLNPETQLGFVWSTQIWVDGRQVSVVFGRPTTSQITYTGILQAGAAPTELYLQAPDGRIFKIVTTTGTWTVVK
jgi:hypothetical protein